MSLTAAQHEHLERVLANHNRLVQRKYSLGQAEHGGDCWTKPGMLRHAKEEHADLTVYLDTLEEQLLTLADKLLMCEIGPSDAALRIVEMVRG